MTSEEKVYLHHWAKNRKPGDSVNDFSSEPSTCEGASPEIPIDFQHVEQRAFPQDELLNKVLPFPPSPPALPTFASSPTPVSDLRLVWPPLQPQPQAPGSCGAGMTSLLSVRLCSHTGVRAWLLHCTLDAGPD